MTTHEFDRPAAADLLVAYLNYVNAGLSGKWEDVLVLAGRFAAAGNFGTADKGAHPGGGGSPEAVESRVFENIDVEPNGDPEQSQDGGGASTQSRQVAIEIRFAEGDRAHAGSGHTYANFALTKANVGKEGDQGFWPTQDPDPNSAIQATAREALSTDEMQEVAQHFAERNAGDTDLSRFVVKQATGFSFGVAAGESSDTTAHNGEQIRYHRMTQLYSVEQRIDRRFLVAVVHLFRAHPSYSLKEKAKKKGSDDANE